MSVLNLRGHLDNLAGSFAGRVIRGRAEPEIGFVVCSDLLSGYAEHSGIYAGDGEIVALEKDGSIVARSAGGFIEGTTAISISMSHATTAMPWEAGLRPEGRGR